MNAYWGSGHIAPHILDSALDGGEWSASCPGHFTSPPPGKNPWYPLDKRLGGPLSWSEHSGEEKSSQPLLGLKATIIKPISQCHTTELSWLLMSRKLHTHTNSNMTFKVLETLLTSILTIRREVCIPGGQSVIW